MTIGQYLSNGFFILGCLLIAVTLIVAMWHISIYVFSGGDDAERIHSKRGLLYATITLMFTMIFWAIFSVLGYVLGL